MLPHYPGKDFKNLQNGSFWLRRKQEYIENIKKVEIHSGTGEGRLMAG